MGAFEVCRNSLLLTDPKIDRASLISQKGQRAPGTCEWLLQNDIYRSWLQGNIHLLCIYGGPGKGKTMISIFLSEKLERFAKDFDTLAIFYFCKNDDRSRNTAAAILRSLLWQITQRYPVLTKHLLQWFDTPQKTQQCLGSAEMLWDLFVNVIQDPAFRTAFCVLDGLDECDEESQRRLAARLTSIPLLVDGILKIVIVSRDIPKLSQIGAKMKLDPDYDKQVDSDINKIISTRVEELSGLIDFDEDFRDYVEAEFLTRSEGTLLWVGYAMVELLKKKTRTQIIEGLRNLPIGLPAIYDQMLLQIKDSQKECSQLLTWTALAARPLSLHELAAAIDIRTSPLISVEQAVYDLVTTCGPFLKVQGQEVVLVHQSARDYLLRTELSDDPILEQFRIKPEEAHLRIAWTCLDCINRVGPSCKEVKISGFLSRNIELSETLAKQHPLL